MRFHLLGVDRVSVMGPHDGGRHCAAAPAPADAAPRGSRLQEGVVGRVVMCVGDSPAGAVRPGDSQCSRQTRRLPCGGTTPPTLTQHLRHDAGSRGIALGAVRVSSVAAHLGRWGACGNGGIPGLGGGHELPGRGEDVQVRVGLHIFKPPSLINTLVLRGIPGCAHGAAGSMPVKMCNTSGASAGMGVLVCEGPCGARSGARIPALDVFIYPGS